MAPTSTVTSLAPSRPGAPWRRRPISSVMSASSRSAAGASTSTRSVRMQTWPLPANPLQTAARAARGRSASASTIIADFPPSSSTAGTRRAAAVAATCLPTAGLPVKKIMSAAAVSAAPASPRPATTSSTPSGSPQLFHNAPTRREVSGVVSDGFSTTALPAASGPMQSP